MQLRPLSVWAAVTRCTLPREGSAASIASMPRSARLVIQPDDDDGLEEKRPEPPAAVASLSVVTGLEDPAISEDALAAAEASRRAFLYQGTVNARTSLFVEDSGSYKFGDWLARPRVKRELQKTELALASAENGTGSIEDVNLFYGITLADFDQMGRFVKAAGRWS